MNSQHQSQPESQQATDSPTDESLDSQDSNLKPVLHEVPMELEHALIRNLAVLQRYNLASAEDSSQVAANVRRNWERGKGGDPIDILARLRAGEGGMLSETVETISSEVAKSLPVTPTRVPFAASLIPPSSFYEKYPKIALRARLMKAPISFTEDLDVMGIASINPFFADELAATIVEEVKKVSSVQPIINIARLDYLGWMKMCEKHFK